MNQPQPYLSYLLRLWQESSGPAPHGESTPQWRASLEWPQSGDRRGFAGLEDLFAFLEEETRSGSKDLEHLAEDSSQPSAIPD
jgi:hypothetical protein